MATDTAGITHTFRVGKYTCTIAAPEPKPGAMLCMSVEWAPDVPPRLSGPELRAYRRGRDAFVAELAARLGGNALVIE